MGNPGELSKTVVASYSSLTAAWFGVLVYFHIKGSKADKAKSQEDHSDVGRAKRLIYERYGSSNPKQDNASLWWIVTDKGEILGHGDTQDTAWINSAFMPFVPARSDVPDRELIAAD